MNFCRAHKPSNERRARALTLLEMMVAVTLLAVIMIGLLAMFNQTQKALHIANAQTDVFENARGAIQMISRDLTEMTLYPDTNGVRSSEAKTFPSALPGGVLPLGSTNLPLGFTEAFWLSRMNDEWQEVGYFVVDEAVKRNSTTAANYGVGTLYRFSTNVHQQVPSWFHKAFSSADITNSHRISDGIVHFVATAVFVKNSGSASNVLVDFFPANTYIIGGFPGAQMLLPAFVDVEIGVLEPQTLKQFQAIKDLNLPAAKDFLRNHAGNIHFFRERVPIRNFVNPYRSNEVP
jgi:type II secretion system protein J